MTMDHSSPETETGKKNKAIIGTMLIRALCKNNQILSIITTCSSSNISKSSEKLPLYPDWKWGKGIFFHDHIENKRWNLHEISDFWHWSFSHILTVFSTMCITILKRWVLLEEKKQFVIIWSFCNPHSLFGLDFTAFWVHKDLKLVEV